MQFSLDRLKQASTITIFLAAIGLLLIVIALWLPFGLKSGDIQENWHIRAIQALNVINYDNSPNLDELALTRPMARMLFWLSYYLTPDSFVGDNLLLISLLWLKGLALMALVLRLFPRQFFLAFLIAAIAILYPIDRGIVSLRVPHVHFGIVAYFFALYCLLSYWQNNRMRYLYFFVVALLLCNLAYEIFYPLIFLSPLLLLLQEKRLSKRFIKVSMAWYIAPILTLAYSYVLIVVLGFGFQASSFQNPVPLAGLIERAISPYTNTLISIWNPAALHFDAQWLPLVLIISVLFFVIASLIYWLNAKEQRLLSIKEFAGFLLGSFLFIGLGFIVLVPTNRAVFHENYRVFLTSSIGAAAFFVAIAYQLGLGILRKWGFLLLNLALSIFLGLSLNFSLNIHQTYEGILTRQGDFYAQILEALPVMPEPVTVIVLPEGGSLVYDFGFILKPHIFSAAMQYLYETQDLVRFAFICGDGQTTCSFQDGQILARFGGSRARYAAERIVLYELHADGRLELLTSHPELPNYQIDLTTTNLVPVPRRLATIFGNR